MSRPTTTSTGPAASTPKVDRSVYYAPRVTVNLILTGEDDRKMKLQ